VFFSPPLRLVMVSLALLICSISGFFFFAIVGRNSAIEGGKFWEFLLTHSTLILSVSPQLRAGFARCTKVPRVLQSEIVRAPSSGSFHFENFCVWAMFVSVSPSPFFDQGHFTPSILQWLLLDRINKVNTMYRVSSAKKECLSP